jgi:hypothetical protein
VVEKGESVKADPDHHDDGLGGQEPSGAHEPGDRLGHPAEGVGVVPGADEGSPARHRELGLVMVPPAC